MSVFASAKVCGLHVKKTCALCEFETLIKDKDDNILDVSSSEIFQTMKPGEVFEFKMLASPHISQDVDYYSCFAFGDDSIMPLTASQNIRKIKSETGITEEDIAKRLIDFGFHAPTMSWPVAGTMMIEPTESEGLSELDRFCDTLIKIKQEIDQVKSGKFDKIDNPIKNAPHTDSELASDNWTHKYTREEAAYPAKFLKVNKFWPPVARVDNVYGDKNIFCTCPSMDEFKEDAA